MISLINQGLRLGIISFGVTHIGMKRKSNQDAIYLNPEHHFYLVADGVGGHNGGDIASLIAAELIPEYLLNHKVDENNIKDYLCKAVEYANKGIMDKVEECPELDGMGTTVVMMYFFKNTLYITNVGDSRCYLVHEDQIYQLTRDHTLAQVKAKMGILTREEALVDSTRNILVRSLGHEENAKVDIFSYKVLNHDCFLLCSDGLYGGVSDDDIHVAIREHMPWGEKYDRQHLERASQALVDLANESGGRDNISVIAAAVQ